MTIKYQFKYDRSDPLRNVVDNVISDAVYIVKHLMM